MSAQGYGLLIQGCSLSWIGGGAGGVVVVVGGDVDGGGIGLVVSWNHFPNFGAGVRQTHRTLGWKGSRYGCKDCVAAVGSSGGACWSWRTCVEEAVDQLLPILFVGGFAKPVSDQSVIIDNYFRYLFKE
jgi:hypothetical protein